MASSLSSSCTTLKHSYDTCFNNWFASYLLLISPPLPVTSTGELVEGAKVKRDQEINLKKKEYEVKCGATYKSYTECLKKAIGEKEGLSEMLENARKEEPLHSWGGIKVIPEDDS